jgi:hypothetical protein
MERLSQFLRRYRGELLLGVAIFIVASASFALGWLYRDRTARPNIVIEQCSEVNCSLRAGEGADQAK